MWSSSAGAAMLAMVKLGWFDSLADFAAGWRPDAVFEPSMPENQRAHKQRVWQVALKRVLRASEPSSI